MKIKSDPLLHLKTKCGKVNLSCFCISAEKNFYRAGSAQDNPFFEGNLLTWAFIRFFENGCIQWQGKFASECCE